METLLGLIVGIGLSAACGFRVFVPMMGMSIAALSGHITLGPGFEWIGTWTALFAFSTATVLEIAAYYVPWVDNVMDVITTPTAIVAGTIATASMLGGISPFLKWSLAVIAGGGVSGIVQGGSVALRAGSSGITGGAANWIVSTVEMVGSVLTTILAIVLPVLCLFAVIWICYRMIAAIARSPFIRDLSARRACALGQSNQNVS
jgi:hypothetical protein